MVPPPLAPTKADWPGSRVSEVPGHPAFGVGASTSTGVSGRTMEGRNADWADRGYQMVCVRGGLRLKEIDCERDQGRQARPGGA